VLVGGCDHNVGVKDSEVYSPNLQSSIIPPSPFNTCTKPAGAYYNGSLVVCGGGADDEGTPCFQYEFRDRSSYEANEWEPFCAMNVHRCRFTMTVVESCNALVVVGGFKSGADIEVYKDGKWRDGPEIDEIHGLIHHCSVSYGDSEVMIIGGFCNGKPTSTVLSVDIRNDEVTKLPSLTRRRYSHACAKTSWNNEEYIVVAGGFSDFSVCNTVEYISASKNSYETPVWKSLASMNIRRFDFGLSMYGDKLAAYGGQPTIDSEKIEVYCPDTDTWKLVGRSLVHPERHFFATMCVPESKFPEAPGYVTEYVKPTTFKPTYAPTEYVKPTYKPTYAPTEYVKPTYKPTYAPTEYVKPTYKPTYAPTEYVEPTTTTMEHVEEEPYATLLIGGCDHDVGVKDTELYSPNIDSSNVPPTPLTSCTKSAGAYYNGSLILCGGGTDDAGTPCYQYEIGPRGSYEPNEWESFCPLNVHRCRFTMTVVESCNALVVVGGFKSGADIEVYRDGKWCDGPEIDEVHGLIHHGSVSYGESEVMIVGGFCGGKPTATVLSVNINNNAVHKLPSLLAPRYAHSCAKASWGGAEHIVVAGGFQDFSVCNSVEYFSTDFGSYNSYEKPQWRELAPMNIRRFDFGLSMYGTKLAAFGGEPTIESEQIEVYCPDTNTWKLIGRSIQHPERHFFTSIAVPEHIFNFY